MRRLTHGPVILMLSVVGCAVPQDSQSEFGPPAGTRVSDEPELPPSPSSQPATRTADPVAALHEKVVIRLHGRDLLTLRGATCRIKGEPISYGLFAAPEGERSPAAGGATPPADFHEDHRLEPAAGPAPSILCRVTYNASATRARVTLSGDGPLPEVTLIAATLAPMLPVRIRSAGNAETPTAVIQSAMGPVAEGLINALYDPESDCALGIEGLVTYALASDGVVLMASPSEPRGRTQAVLTLTSHENVLGRADSGTVLDGYLPSPAPAGWSACRADRTDEQILVAAQWMHANIEPFGAEYMVCDPARLPHIALADTVYQLGLKIATCRDDGSLDVARTRGLDPVAARSPSRQDPDDPGSERLTQLATTAGNILQDYRFHGIAYHLDPGPISINPPLSLDRARLWASLMGLSGLVLTIEDQLDRLPADRVELLRRVCPPGPIRGMDLFGHGGTVLPDLWDLKIATEFDSWDVLGVFNWGSQSVERTVRLGELGIRTEEQARFAVYDFWGQRLLAVTNDRFAVSVSPTSCRVVCIRRLREGQPTLISTSRHITQGGMDLHDVAFDARTLTMSGRSDLVADDPYELRFFVPEGDASFEITDVDADGASSFVRSAGPLLIVTLESDESRRAAWHVTFARGSRRSEPPAAPWSLNTEQNTRGVRMDWLATDDAAVTYSVYRDDVEIVEVDGGQHEFQDSDVRYGTDYTYSVAAVDWAGRTSARSEPVRHRTPIPADTYLTRLVPLSARQDLSPLGVNRSIGGRPLRIAGRRYYWGLGTDAGECVTYFLGAGYESFSGEIGIDDETGGNGSVVFEIRGDDEPLLKSDVIRGGQSPQRFSVSVKDKKKLTLIVTDAGDGAEGDHADWGDAYLRAARRWGPVPSSRPTRTSRPTSRPATQPAAATPPVPAAMPGDRVLIDTSLGEIVVELDVERTPVTVGNFLRYVGEGFYDDTIFHRVVKGFVIQGGGFTADLAKKPTHEPIRNESNQGGSNARGTIAMARTGDPNSATSQFYINLGNNTRLDRYGGGYCVFGKVVAGMDVADRIAAVQTERRGAEFQNLPSETVFIRSVRRH